MSDPRTGFHKGQTPTVIHHSAFSLHGASRDQQPGRSKPPHQRRSSGRSTYPGPYGKRVQSEVHATGCHTRGLCGHLLVCRGCASGCVRSRVQVSVNLYQPSPPGVAVPFGDAIGPRPLGGMAVGVRIAHQVIVQDVFGLVVREIGLATVIVPEVGDGSCVAVWPVYPAGGEIGAYSAAQLRVYWKSDVELGVNGMPLTACAEPLAGSTTAGTLFGPLPRSLLDVLLFRESSTGACVRPLIKKSCASEIRSPARHSPSSMRTAFARSIQTSVSKGFVLLWRTY